MLVDTQVLPSYPQKPLHELQQRGEGWAALRLKHYISDGWANFIVHNSNSLHGLSTESALSAIESEKRGKNRWTDRRASEISAPNEHFTILFSLWTVGRVTMTNKLSKQTRLWCHDRFGRFFSSFYDKKIWKTRPIKPIVMSSTRTPQFNNLWLR